MITSFRVENSALIKRMFKFEMEYVDMMVTYAGVGIISNTSEMFIQKFFPSLVPEHHEKDICFRVNRTTFLSLLGDGMVEVKVNDFGTVEMTFSGADKPKRKVSFGLQYSDLSLILAKLEIFKYEHKFSREDIKALSGHLGWYKTVAKVANVKDGYLIHQIPERRIYQKVKCPDLSANVQYLRYLLDYTDDHFFFQDYIIGRGENINVVLNQQNMNVADELDYIRNLPSSHMIEVMLADVYKLLKMLPKPDTILIDFESKEAVINSGKERITTDIKITRVESVASRLKKASVPSSDTLDIDDLFSGAYDSPAVISTKSEHDMPKIVISSDILLNIIGTKSERLLVVNIKKGIVQISLKNGMEVVISKVVA